MAPAYSAAPKSSLVLWYPLMNPWGFFLKSTSLLSSTASRLMEKESFQVSCTMVLS